MGMNYSFLSAKHGVVIRPTVRPQPIFSRDILAIEEDWITSADGRTFSEFYQDAHENDGKLYLTRRLIPDSGSYYQR